VPPHLTVGCCWRLWDRRLRLLARCLLGSQSSCDAIRCLAELAASLLCFAGRGRPGRGKDWGLLALYEERGLAGVVDSQSQCCSN